jgi:hypothetical protein
LKVREIESAVGRKQCDPKQAVCIHDDGLGHFIAWNMNGFGCFRCGVGGWMSAVLVSKPSFVEEFFQSCDY